MCDVSAAVDGEGGAVGVKGMWEAIFGLIGVVVGSGLVIVYSYYRDRREREEKYKVMTFEKRLEAHQEAFNLIRELNKSFPASIEAIDEVKTKIIAEARDKLDKWWALHCFYLDPKSQDRILEVIVRSDELVFDYGLPKDSSHKWDEDKRNSWLKERSEFTSFIDATKTALVEGIRMKHIEEPMKEQPKGKS